ncbi:hypothetical protein H4Q26_005359 [Puccinia striiformis f. sp. tritici PST-130]|nr:hypothetical protein H4Q26_005359 [Puccinia striiformis f. sp. tritici PST-130]
MDVHSGRVYAHGSRWITAPAQAENAFLSSPHSLLYKDVQVGLPGVHRDENSAEVFQSKLKGSVTIPDPYSWLHEPPKQSKQTQEFVTNQEHFTKQYLKKYAQRDLLHKTVTKNWDYARFSCPSLKPDGQYTLTTILDYKPNRRCTESRKEEKKMKKDRMGVKNRMGSYSWIPIYFDRWDHCTLVYFGIGIGYIHGLCSFEVRKRLSIYLLRRTDSPHPKSAADGAQKGQDPIPDHKKPDHNKSDSDLQECEVGTDTKADLNHMLYFHRLGDPQSKDLLIVEDPENPSYMWGAEVSDDGRYLILTTSKDTGRSNRIGLLI